MERKSPREHSHNNLLGSKALRAPAQNDPSPKHTQIFDPWKIYQHFSLLFLPDVWAFFLSTTITDYQITAKRRCVPRARLSPTEWPWAGVVSLPLPGESRPLPYTPATPPTPSHRLRAKQQVFRKPPLSPILCPPNSLPPSLFRFFLTSPLIALPVRPLRNKFSPPVRVVAPSNMARGRGEWCFLRLFGSKNTHFGLLYLAPA